MEEEEEEEDNRQVGETGRLGRDTGRQGEDR